MTNRVPKEDIELKVGRRRDPIRHYGKLRTDDWLMYILHSQECVDSFEDLRECPYSLALDRGVDELEWPTDVTVHLGISDGSLVDKDNPNQ